MIQFETVKYGILKKTKDNQKMSKGDSTSSCSEEDVLLPETNTLTDETCANMSNTELIENNTTCINEGKAIDQDCPSSVNDNDDDNDAEMYDRQSIIDGNTEQNTNGLATSNNDHDVAKLSKHNEDAANNNSNEQDAAGEDEESMLENKIDNTKSEQPLDNGFGATAGASYFSMEAIQKMAQLVSTAMTNNSDNEDAQKQLTLLQSTLFTLQHQQLFQMQLIQQLQSQLSLTRTGKTDDDLDDDDEEMDHMEHGGGDDEREEGELSEEQMAEEQRKYEEEQKAIEYEKEKLRLKQQQKLQQQQQQQQDKEKTNEQDRIKEYDATKPLDPNDNRPNNALSAMEASFSSPFSSNIITNHDEPSSMDGLNSLEMLQKRAEEVLDSASKGILSGGLTDEMAFKNDGKGRNEPFFKHRCRYCGKVFGSDSALQIHIRSHTGERPFRCNVCGSRFTTKGNLKVHFQRHTQKFPHIPMNPNPIPEHLDKFYPPLLPPIPPGQQAPLSPPAGAIGAAASAAAAAAVNANVPAVPLNLPNLPFPPIPGLPANLQGLQSQLQGLQGLHGLPFLRPPFDLLKQMGAHPFFGAMRDAVQQQQQKERELEQEAPADLSKPADLTKSQIKEEPKDDGERDDGERSQIADDVIDKQKRSRDSKSPMDERKHGEPIEKRRSLSPLHHHRRSSWKDDNKSEGMSPTPSSGNYSPKAEQPENLSSRISLKHHSPSSVGSTAARDNHFAENQNDLKMFPTLLPRPGSNDNSWESFIEVDRSSETSKLQQFVDNIESKITEPNECGVCHKVLSCHSALIMHYRTHTGIRPFKCLICGRKFTTKGNLKTHMSVHRMKPPTRTVHQCPVCHKKYSNSLVLQQHIRLHTGEPTDLTLEQISAAEITQSPSAAFPMGLNPFAFPMAGLHPGMSGAESSNGDNDELMDEDFDEESNYEDASQTGSISGDSNQNISSSTRLNSSEELREPRTLRSDHNKSIENLSRAPSAISHADSADEKRSSSPRTPQPLSPAPSDMSQGALDLTPRSEPKSSANGPNPLPTSAAAAAAAAVAGLNAFPNFSFMHHNAINTTSPMMSSALANSLVQSVAPMGPFNPMALSGVRGNTTCKICFKTFACQSALEIHYRSHTKERPFKCSICDKAFTTKGNMKQHMMTHKLRDVPQHMFSNNKIEQSRNLSPDSGKDSAPPLRVRSEAELNPRAATTPDHRERSLSAQFQSQVDSNYQLMLERQHHLEQMQRQHQMQSRHSPLHLQRQSISAMSPPQHIKNELNAHARPKSIAEADQPAAKRQLLSDSQDIPTSLKEAYQMPPLHESEKTAASHLERLQQFHTSSLLNQPIKLDPSSHIKSSATSPSSNDADQKHFCHLCQKNFSSTSSLQIHMRTHTGERPFVCSVCQKAFTTKGNLKVHMGIHTWSGASRRGRRMSLELPFNGSMPLMLQNPDFLQRHSDFFHPYPPHLLSRMSLEHQQQQQQKLDREAINLASKYMNSNGLSRVGSRNNERQYSNPSSPVDSDKQQISPNSLRDERYSDSPKRNGDRDHSPSPRMWKLHYESKAMNRDPSKSKGDDQNKPVEELTA